MSMKRFIKRNARSALRGYHAWKQLRFYRHLVAENGLKNAPQEREEEWRAKWSGLGMKPNPIYYRLFSHYVGQDMNIIPEDISHDVVEPLLCPQRFSKTYADKNFFDRLFPEGYLPETVLRRMNGFWYDAAYRRLDLDERTVCGLLDRGGAERMILKPSVEGSSGRGIRMIERKQGRWTIGGVRNSPCAAWKGLGATSSCRRAWNSTPT